MGGATVYINGMWFYFERVEDLVDVLNINCNDAGYDSEKDCIIEYDEV